MIKDTSVGMNRGSQTKHAVLLLKHNCIFTDFFINIFTALWKIHCPELELHNVHVFMFGEVFQNLIMSS